MFRPMRRAAQRLADNETKEILSSATSGVLALSGDGGYPYALPMSFAYSDGKIYFHSAVEGHKIDSVRRCEKASFCVISEDNILPEKYTTAYRSVIAFGKMRFAEGSEVIEGLRLLGRKYAPDDSAENCDIEINASLSRVAVLVMNVEHVTGKESKELMLMREKEES